MNDVSAYLRRNLKYETIRANISTSDAQDDLYESMAWDWIEQNHPEIMAIRDRVDISAARDVVSRAVAQLRIASPKLRLAIAEKLQSRLFGAGPIDGLMLDPAVTEITVTGTRVRALRDTEEGSRWEVVPNLIKSPADATALADFLCTRAGARYQPVRPLQTIIWPSNGARINVVHESVTGNDGPVLTIRKRNRGRILDLPNLIDMAMLNEDMAYLLTQLIKARCSMVIAGATNTGKTTVLRALAKAAIPKTERLITIEDIDELQLIDFFPDGVSLVGREKTDIESYEVDVSIHSLFVNSLRMTPDRLIVGEVRGQETKDVLEAGVTEANGLMFTVHLKHPRLLFNRFYWMLASSGLQLPMSTVEQQVRDALDIIVHITRFEEEDGRVIRRITSISEVLESGDIVPLWSWDGEDWVPEHEVSTSLARQIALYG